MISTEGKRLAEFSRAVRESTIKRLKKVPQGKEHWSPEPGGMSFADTAHHLAESDKWLFQKLNDPALTKMEGKAGEAAGSTPGNFQTLIAHLQELGERRTRLLSTLTDEVLDSPMHDDRFGDVTVWWVIVRGNLDHEAHHRGQLAVYLRLIHEGSG